MNLSNENMSEKETKLGGQERKTSRLAEYSALSAILAITVALMTAPSLLCAPFAVTGLVLGIIALWQISRSKGKLSGLVPAIFGIVINSALPFVLLHFSYMQTPGFEMAHRVVCGTNLSELGKAIQNYTADNYGVYPPANKWCDLLVQNDHATRRIFVCKSALAKGDEGRCHYAINRNCEPNSQGNMVLLFESKGGWNQYGGPELLAPENHDGDGCNILFNDGHVEFVRTEELGELMKWK